MYCGIGYNTLLVCCAYDYECFICPALCIQAIRSGGGDCCICIGPMDIDNDASNLVVSFVRILANIINTAKDSFYIHANFCQVWIRL